MTSGQSIVIISELAKRAYKKNMEPSECKGLMQLLGKQTIKGKPHPQIGLPVSLFEVDMNTMIAFDLYHPPLTSKENSRARIVVLKITCYSSPCSAQYEVGTFRYKTGKYLHH